jgi:hypothetical protein
MPAVAKFAITPSGCYQGDDLMTAQEVADWLKVKPSWVAEQVKDRTQIRSKNPLPHIRLGKYTRFSRMRIVEWLAENSTGHCV